IDNLFIHRSPAYAFSIIALRIRCDPGRSDRRRWKNNVFVITLPTQSKIQILNILKGVGRFLPHPFGYKNSRICSWNFRATNEYDFSKLFY
ncbi:hypothetical protein ACRCJN_10970, partial [Aerococcus urinaeequi]|uniref:hypothetical protein n=1 Tax=Aerococcus urinaeequi TaxID=51665 RepID=UPI003D6A4B75